jgi:hypothetical protein
VTINSTISTLRWTPPWEHQWSLRWQIRANVERAKNGWPSPLTMVDGSVQAVSNDVDVDVWTDMGTRDGMPKS